jgi:hypothetical protein
METPTERITEEMNTDVMTVTSEATAIKIVDGGTFDITTEFMVKLASRLKQVKKHFKPMKEATQKAHKVIVQQEKDMLNGLIQADIYLRGIRATYADEQEKKQRKEQDRLDKLADKKAQKEKEKLQKKIDNAETQAEVNELQDKLNNVYADPNIASGGIEKSTKVEGGGSTSWIKDIEVVVEHPLELLEEIVSGRIPLNVVEIKTAKLKVWVKANGITNKQVPGIRVKETRRESVRAG